MALRASVELLLRVLRALIADAPVSMSNAQWSRFIRALYPLVVQARGDQLIESLRVFEREAARFGDRLPDDLPPVFYDLRALDKRLTQVVREPLEAGEPRDLVSVAAEAAVERHVAQAGRDLTRELANSGGTEAVAWARRLTGAENCAFCVMLASRGPVYLSASSASVRSSYMQKFHDGCDCEVVAVYDRNNWEGRTAFLEAERRWKSATKGVGYQDALNALRRDLAKSPFEIPAETAA